MNLLRLFFTEEKIISTDIKEFAEKYEALSMKYFEALEFYCAECKRGFDKRKGKQMHIRWQHSGNPPIVNKQNEQTT